tara:strand:+ start:267 stop:815 length:549 start_codon:yes stop_codon:yes gene_type:complete
MAVLQLQLFGEAAQVKTRSYLADPLTREEQRRFGRMYADNIGLVRKFSHRLAQQYGHCLAREDINSCCDFAFLKTCRAWNPEKGKLSTIYWRFALGEVLHFLRSHNWSIGATHRARELGLRARKLLEMGWSPDAVCTELSISDDDLRDYLVATSGMAHDTMGFDLQVCPRMTPWEALEAAET